MAGERAAGGGNQPSLDVGIEEQLRRTVGSANALAYFIVFNGEYPQRVFVVTRQTMIIGRDDDADLQVSDASVSAHHARVTSRGAGFELEDLNSTNGVFVDGEPVRRAGLHNGSRVMVGAVDLMFLLERPTSATIRLPLVSKRPAIVAALPGVGAAVSPAPPRSAPRREEGEQSFEDLIRKLAAVYQMVRKEFRRIAILVLLGTAAGLASVPLLPPPTTAATEVKLLPRPTFVSNNPEERWQNNAEEASGTFVKGAERVLTQPDFVRATLLSLTGVALEQRRIIAVVGNIKVEETGDHLLRVTYRDKANPGVQPVEFLSEHVRRYIQGEINKTVREVTAKVAFLSDQLKTVDTDLNRIGAERAGFRELNVDRLPEDATQTSTSRHAMETRRVDLVSEIHRLEGDLKAEQLQLSKDSPVARTRFQWSETYRQSLVDVNRKLSEAYARGLTDGHPEVKQLKDERQRIQALAKDELQAATSNLVREADPNYQQAHSRVEKLRADLGAARANLAETDRTLGRLRKVEKDLPRVEQQLSDLDHRQTATKQLHGELFSKLKQAEIQLNLEKVSAESRFDVSPVVLDKPRRVLTVMQRSAIGMFAGLGIAAMLIALREGRRKVSLALASSPSASGSTLLRPGERRDP